MRGVCTIGSWIKGTLAIHIFAVEILVVSKVQFPMSTLSLVASDAERYDMQLTWF